VYYCTALYTNQDYSVVPIALTQTEKMEASMSGGDGVRWHCSNRDCNWSFVATTAPSANAEEAPHCVCGRTMRRGFVMVYLVWPTSRRELSRHEHESIEVEIRKNPVLTVYGETVQSRMVAKQALGAGKNLPGPMKGRKSGAG
jgi:hypothetical protein